MNRWLTHWNKIAPIENRMDKIEHSRQTNLQKLTHFIFSRQTNQKFSEISKLSESTVRLISLKLTFLCEKKNEI